MDVARNGSDCEITEEVCDEPSTVLLDQQNGGVGLFKSIFNFSTLIIGGGLLGWPSTFALCGWLGGAFCLVFMCLFAQSTMVVMVAIGMHLGTISYEETCCAVWGRRGFYAVAITCLLIDFGVIVSYMVALGDIATPLVHEFVPSSTNIVDLQMWVKVAFSLVMLPVAYSRNFGKLPGWSYVQYAFILFSSFAMLAMSFNSSTANFNRDHVKPEGVPLKTDTTEIKAGLWPSLGVLAFTYVNHDSVFTIVQSLYRPSVRRWTIVCRTSMWSTVLLTLAVGLPIYIVFGVKTSSDIVDNFPRSPVMITVRFCLVCVLAMTCLYLQQVGRKYLHSIVMPFMRRRALTPSESYNMSILELVVFTTFFFAAAVVTATVTEDLGLPMALTGVFANSLAAFVIPPCLLLTMASHGDPVGYSKLNLYYYGFILLFGIVSCTLGVYSTLQHYGVFSGS